MLRKQEVNNAFIYNQLWQPDLQAEFFRATSRNPIYD
jgi:hypothetical protein